MIIMRKIPLTDVEALKCLLEGLRLSGDHEFVNNTVNILQIVPDRNDDAGTHCMTCQYTFGSRKNQVGHYKSDWHRYNLKLKVMGKMMVTEKKFEEIMDEISSISGSESDSSETLDSDDEIKLQKALSKVPSVNTESVKTEVLQSPLRGPKIYFRNSSDQLFSVYKCILPHMHDGILTFSNMENINSHLMEHKKICIILLSAGHFAAAVLQGGDVIVHKTFHRYVLRAKQGTVQSLRDKQNAGFSAPKSGGATLRRYNEDALTRDIQRLLNSWKDVHISSCSYIFLRAPHHSKGIFYNGKTAPLDRKDVRIKGIPFPTRRPTFNELKRVHSELFSIFLHDNRESLGVEQKSVINEQMSQEKVFSYKSMHVESPCTEKRKQKKLKSKIDKSLSNPAATASGESQDEDFRSSISDELFTVCKTADIAGLKAVISSIECELEDENNEHQSEKKSHSLVNLLNQPFGKENVTLLHIAAKAGHRDIVWHLLQCGADPAFKNIYSMTPYSVSSDKAMRNTFRRFMAENSEMYDYKSACIPAPLTQDMEEERKFKLNEKKKAQRFARKERLKQQKEMKTREMQEQQERERFASLSDREKRAVAAERRLAQKLTEAGSETTISVKRCWLCGESLLGKIPFEYYDYQFCTVACLKKQKSEYNITR